MTISELIDHIAADAKITKANAKSLVDSVFVRSITPRARAMRWLSPASQVQRFSRSRPARAAIRVRARPSRSPRRKRWSSNRPSAQGSRQQVGGFNHRQKCKGRTIAGNGPPSSTAVCRVAPACARNLRLKAIGAVRREPQYRGSRSRSATTVGDNETLDHLPFSCWTGTRNVSPPGRVLKASKKSGLTRRAVDR